MNSISSPPERKTARIMLAALRRLSDSVVSPSMNTASRSDSVTILPRGITTWPVTKLRVTDSAFAAASSRRLSVAFSL